MATRYCQGCKEELGKHKGKKTGLCYTCYQKEYARNKTKVRQEQKRFLSNIGCAVCGESHYSCLEVHHFSKAYKRFGRSQNMEYNLDDLSKDKAVVLCANCHNLFHGFFGGKSLPFPELTKEQTIETILHFRRIGG